MDRKQFFKAVTAVIVTATAIDKLPLGEVSVAEAVPVAVVHDSIIYDSPALHMQAHRNALLSMDKVLKEYYLPPIREHLQRTQCTTCGAHFQGGFLNRDGEIFRDHHNQPGMAKAIMYAYCRCHYYYSGLEVPVPLPMNSMSYRNTGLVMVYRVRLAREELFDSIHAKD